MFTKVILFSAVLATTYQTTDFKPYYYPIDDLKETRVYHYVSDENSYREVYTVLSTKVSEDGTQLLDSKSYVTDEFGKLTLFETTERIVNDRGVIVQNYTEHEYDTFWEGYPIKATIKDNTVFEWNMVLDKMLTYSYQLVSTIDEGYITSVEQQRTFKGESETVKFRDKSVKTIKVQDDFLTTIENKTKKEKATYNYSQINYFAENIGLYKYTRNMPKGSVTYELAEILTIEKWKTILN